MKVNSYYYEIYQVEPEKEFAFMKWEWAKKYNWTFKTYNKVFKSCGAAISDYDLLNYLFKIFNIDLPERFKGHSMSVSDIVKICINGDENKAKYYYCDSFGWVDITKEIKGE